MNNTRVFDFSINKENNSIHVRRDFDADLALVWKSWTTAELLDQWWGPEPYHAETKSMDFREGGSWLYAMVGPKQEKHWARFDYEHIDSQKRFTGLDAFCDEAGTINKDFSRMHWENVFTEAGNRTEVNIKISIDSLETLEKILEMGFKEGFTTGLQQLDELLAKLKK